MTAAELDPALLPAGLRDRVLGASWRARAVGRPVPEVAVISPVEAFSRTADALYRTLCGLEADVWSRPVLRGLDVQCLIGHLIGVEHDLVLSLTGDLAVARADHTESTWPIAIAQTGRPFDQTRADWRRAVDQTLELVRAQPDLAQPDLVQPDLVQPDVVQPDLARPDTVQPDPVQPDLAQPDLARVDPAQPDLAQPDVVQPDLDGEVALHGMRLPLGALLIVRAFELWTHDDDIRRVAGLPLTEPDRPTLRLMTELAAGLLPHAAARMGQRDRVSVHLVLTGPGGGTWDLAVGEECPESGGVGGVRPDGGGVGGARPDGGGVGGARPDGGGVGGARPDGGGVGGARPDGGGVGGARPDGGGAGGARPEGGGAGGARPEGGGAGGARPEGGGAGGARPEGGGAGGARPDGGGAGGARPDGGGAGEARPDGGGARPDGGAVSGARPDGGAVSIIADAVGFCRLVANRAGPAELDPVVIGSSRRAADILAAASSLALD
jgi:hypothetical protein